MTLDSIHLDFCRNLIQGFVSRCGFQYWDGHRAHHANLLSPPSPPASPPPEIMEIPNEDDDNVVQEHPNEALV